MAADRKQIASVLLGLISSLLACMQHNVALLNAEISYPRRRVDICKLFTLSTGQNTRQKQLKRVGKQCRPRRFWVRPGRTSAWWDNFVNPPEWIRIRVDGRIRYEYAVITYFRIRKEKVSDSKISGYVWTGPKASPFDPLVHLTPADLQVNSCAKTQSFRVFVKCWKAERLFNVFRLWLISTLSCDCIVRLPSPEENWCWISISLPRWPASFLVSAIVISVIHPSGVPGKFSDRSFRIGAATTVAQKSLHDHLIMMLGRWSSNVYQLGVRTPVETILSVVVMLS